MKRLICLFLVSLFLISFCGCQEEEDPSVQFYYLRSQYIYGAEDGVIAAEVRDITQTDINYLLPLYLNGPQSEELSSPFPSGTRLVSSHMQDGFLSLELSKEFAQLKNMDLTLAAGCIASTCFNLTDAHTVRITASSSRGDISVSLTRESLTRIDDSAAIAESSDPNS